MKHASGRNTFAMPPTRDIMITGYHDSKSTDVMDNMLHARMYFKIGI